ncbi:Calnexin [Fasciola gigantica]|uniref:Calnexin n=1 Tax=Fasciola gigantica TaxID=46835 RepID=A0A504YRX2_FASGI|nr:Calnexin [Fasciola gigantica]
MRGRSVVLSLLLTICLFVVCHSGEEVENKAAKPFFVKPSLPADAYLSLYFEGPSDIGKRLFLSTAKKEGIDDSIAKYDGVWSVETLESFAIEGDHALVLKSKAKHHAISAKLDRHIKFNTPELVVQYEVKFENGMECGGAYIKLLSAIPNLDLLNFHDKTPYTIMFGPDKCGMDTKFHFIIRHKNVKTGKYEEKHAKKVAKDLESLFTDKRTHLFTLGKSYLTVLPSVLRSDNTFERYIDQEKVQSGSLLEDMDPPINPPKEIDDPKDKKPDDWDERETIVDETATKPDDWDETAPEFIIDESAVKPSGWLDDESELIPDPNAEKPHDWDVDMDGEWEAPMVKNPKCADAPGCGEWHKPQIKNPKYKGKWTPPVIRNPNYKGKWRPAKIPNPDYYEDKEPYKNLAEVAAVGWELWTMTDNIVFDNILIVDSLRAANDFAKETWFKKRDAERMADPKARSVIDAVKETFNEKPWLFAVIGLVCTIPIFLCCVYMCRSSSPTITAASRKKTDEPTPDDETTKYTATKVTNDPASQDGEDLEDEEEEEEGAEDGENEEEEREDGETTEEDVVQVPKGASGDSKKGKDKTEQTEDSNEEAPATVESVASAASKQQVRKRRARKE